LLFFLSLFLFSFFTVFNGGALDSFTGGALDSFTGGAQKEIEQLSLSVSKRAAEKDRELRKLYLQQGAIPRNVPNKVEQTSAPPVKESSAPPVKKSSAPQLKTVILILNNQFVPDLLFVAFLKRSKESLPCRVCKNKIINQ
jgi:hypothetical protein